jgi:hypothetical protein
MRALEISSEIRAHLPIWRQKLLDILEDVEHKRKSKEKRKTRIKTLHKQSVDEKN